MLASQVKIDFRPAPYIFIRNYNDNKNYAYNQKNQDTFLCEKILSLKARDGEIRPLLLLKRPVGQRSAITATETISSGCDTMPLPPVPRLIISTYSMPETTSPQTVYCPLSHGASAKQIKN